MEQKLEEESAFSLMKEQLENYTSNQRENISSCVENCGAKSLVEKLIEIVDNAEKQKEEGNGKRKRGPSTSQPEIAAIQSSMERACSNSVVIRHILSYLDARTLFKLRQVRRLWREEATSLLLNERFEKTFIVEFEFEPEPREKRFWHQTGSKLSEFIDTCLKNSRIFPCSQFSFQGGKLSHPDLTAFFSECGHHVRHLTLNPRFVHIASLENILFKWTPNLKSLEFQPDCWIKKRPGPGEHWNDESSSESEPEPESESETEPGTGQLDPDLNLPLKLRKITLPRVSESAEDKDLIFKILTSSPHLTSIEDPLLTYIFQLISAQKLPLVTSLTLSWTHLHRSKSVRYNFLKFVTQSPTITNLTFEETTTSFSRYFNLGPSLISTLKRLLTLNQGSLTMIKEVQGLGLISDPTVRFCPLPEVTQATLSVVGCRAGTTRRILPVGNHMSQFLPNLKSMHVELYKLDSEALNFPFISPSDAHLSLTELKLSNLASEDYAESCFEYVYLCFLQRLFPSVTHLHLAMFRCGAPADCFRDCWRLVMNHYKELESLVLEVWIEDDSEIEEDFKTEVDQLLTGLDCGDCERLWSRAGNPDDPEFQEIAAEMSRKIRTRPSILDLRQLTSLTFGYHFQGPAKQLWTSVTQACAFQLMAERQGLQVFVGGTQGKDLNLEKNDLGPI